MNSVIQLPARFKRNDKKEIKNEVSTTSTLRDKLQSVRSKRVTTFFRAKAAQRAGIRYLTSVVGSNSDAVLTVLRSLRQLARGFFTRKLEKLTAFIGQKWRKLWTLIGYKSVKSMMQRTLGRTFGRSKDNERQHARMYQCLCRALARLGRSAIATARKRRVIEDTGRIARETVDGVMKEVAVKVAAMRERERLGIHARVIQRLWRHVKNSEQAGVEAKVRLLSLLTNLPPILREYQQTQRQRLQTVHETSVNTVAYCIRRVTQRLAARLVQRVWRGYCARKRVRRIREWKRKKFVRQRQRERLREARGALLEPSEAEKTRRKVVKTRLLARQEMPLPVPQGRYQRRRGERVSLLEPLPLQSRPPHTSYTGTKVQCVPFSRFEKIVAQDARVNLSNVWVAIPVGHQELPLEREELKRGLSPLLVGKGRRRQKGALQTTYDWVPAHLLQSKAERDATALRRQRASPSVSKTILDF
ncbi:hypothetical protein F443_00519 [Phytophthora nicotianae P1569]|uniref:Uncharacterized protein n=1 Tax=Phytophthora nicotianae P1569 TaxID=1317065 RepID=V9G2P1_PHYNI|nr:hypothetical protein F443_00519 [Phytophthora nicotianae P1569]